MSTTNEDMEVMNTNPEAHYNDFINTLRQIQSNVLQLNEADDEGGGDDLDALLKGNDEGGGEDNKEDAGGDDGGADKEGGDDDALGDLNLDDEGGEGDDGGADDLDLSGGEEEKDSFETDNEGLMDTITKLTKAGHTVKIVVSAEGKQTIESVDGKKIKSMKQLNEMVSKLPVKGRIKMSNQNDKMLTALMEQMNTLTKEVNKLRKSNTVTPAMQPIEEERYIKVKEADYNALIEMAEDMNFKIDEQDAIIKNYEAMQEFNTMDIEADESINDILNELDESIAELNRNTTNNKIKFAASNSYSRGIDKSLSVFTEDVLPFINNINIARANILDEMDMYETLNKIKDSKKVYQNNGKVVGALNGLNESLNELNKLNAISEFTSMIESHLSNADKDATYTKDDIMRAINEATGDICIANPDYEYDNRYPQYEYFSRKVSQLLSNAYTKRDNSLIADYEDNGDLVSRQQLKKFDLPIMNPEKWNASVTIKSAIANLSEALMDIDGNLNLDLCKRAYLYHKTNNPKTMKDFAMPIAIYEQSEGQLYAHPVLIKNVANILKNDSCMKTYDIGSREKLYALRESITPYLTAIGEDIPW